MELPYSTWGIQAAEEPAVVQRARGASRSSGRGPPDERERPAAPPPEHWEESCSASSSLLRSCSVVERPADRGRERPRAPPRPQVVGEQPPQRRGSAATEPPAAQPADAPPAPPADAFCAPSPEARAPPSSAPAPAGRAAEQAVRVALFVGCGLLLILLLDQFTRLGAARAVAGLAPASAYPIPYGWSQVQWPQTYRAIAGG